MNTETRLSTALDRNPAVLELIVSLNPHDFARLRHPRMRRLMAPRITLRRVAAMAGIAEDDLMSRLNGLVGDGDVQMEALPALVMRPEKPPEWMAGVQEADIPWVDVTPQDDRFDDPLPAIMAGWKAIQPGEALGIRHRWEPQPLYDVWTKLGLGFWARQEAADLWSVFVYRPKVGEGAL
jgi:hypothetical protein